MVIETKKNTIQRPKQINCQVEPPYPLHETIVFSIRYPDVYLKERKETKEVEICSY